MEKSASSRRRGGLAAKFPEPTEGLDTIVDAFAATLVETVTYFIWYFWAPIALGLSFQQVPILRGVPKEILGVCAGGLAQIVWVKYLSLGKSSQLDLILSHVVRSPRRINHAHLVSESLGVLVGCWCLGVAWSAASSVVQGNLLGVTIVNMPGLPRFDYPRLPSSTRGIKAEHEAFFAAFLTEFILSFFHWWGMGLAVVGSDRLEGIQHFRCFVSPAMVILGKSALGYRPSLNSSVALITGFKNPRFVSGLLLLALADVLAAVSVIVVPRYFRRRTRVRSEEEHLPSSSAEATSSATFLKTCDKPLIPESSSTMPSSTAQQPPSPMVTRRRAKDKNKTPPVTS